MRRTDTEIGGVCLIEPVVHGDHRGFFMECYHRDRFATLTRRRGHEFVTLDEAIGDPAYTTADRYAGPAGTSWLFRWDATQAETSGSRKVDWRAEPEPQAWVRELFDNR